MGKLFSPMSLIDESTSVVSVVSTDSYIDESYFVETLNFLAEQNRVYSLLNANLYRSISESGNDPIIIREAFSDFFGAIKNFIKKIIAFLKKLLAKFWVRINSLFLRDKYIEQHKDELAKFTTTHEFDISGYTYTFKEDVPKIDVLMNIDQSLADFASGSSGDKKNAKDAKAMKTAYDNFLAKKNSNRYLDDMRQTVIGAKSPIDESSYKEELFKVYRNGDKDKSKVNVTNSVVMDALAFFTGYEKLKNATQRQADNVEKIYGSIQKKLDRVNVVKDGDVENVTIEDIVDGDSSNDKLALYDLFLKAKSQEIQLISNLHTMAFSAKLDAIKDCFTQDKTILYGAFKKLLAKQEGVIVLDGIPDYVVESEVQ